MRHPLLLSAAIALLAATVADLPAQGVMGRLKQRVQQKIEQKVENAVETKADELTAKLVDSSFAKLFGDGGPGTSGGASGSAGSGGARAPFLSMANATTETEYRFDVRMDMEVSSFAASGPTGDKVAMTMHVSTAHPWAGVRVMPANAAPGSETVVIFDATNQAMVMLLTMPQDQKRLSIAYQWNEAARYLEQKTVDWSALDTAQMVRDFRRIGTKQVAGYTATGYRAETPTEVTEVWVSRDPRLRASQMFGAAGSMKGMRGKVPTGMPEGVPLETTVTDRKSGRGWRTMVTAVRFDDAARFVMADYPRQTLGK